jgi:hypothetical protein
MIRPVVHSVVRSVLGGSSSSWKSYWKTQTEVLFFGEISKIKDGKLYNQKTRSTDYLTVGGSVGSYTFQCPQTDAYKNADTDYIWINKDGTTWRIVLESELIGYDLQRTPVKYLDDSPNSIEAILILNQTIPAAKRNKLFRDFHLPIMWDNSWNDYGYEKYNRPDTEQILWAPIPTGVTLTLISGGVKIDWVSDYQVEIWGQSDGADYALINTVNAGTTTYSDTTAPVDLRYYKIRVKDGSNYSPFTNPVSIAMLGAEIVDQALWFASGLAWWNNRRDSDFAGDGAKLTVSNATAYLIRASGLTLTKTYKVVVTATLGATTYIDCGNATGAYTQGAGTGTFTGYITNAVATQIRIRTSSVATLRTLTALSIKQVL